MSEAHNDIIIVGGGMAGASAGAHLAATHRVVILERESLPGYHSTGRSAALFSESYGNEPVRALTRASRGFFMAPPEGFTEHPLLIPRGTLHLATHAQTDALDAMLAAPDMTSYLRRFDADAVMAACPVLRADLVAGGAFEQGASDIEVHALHDGYLRRFRRLGGTLVTDAQMQACRRANGVWQIETRAGAFAAPILVNAAGAWADDIGTMAGAGRLGIQPCRRTALLAELPEGLAAAHWPMVVDIDEQFYFKPDAGLLLLTPADETPVPPCDVQPEELDVAIAIDRVEQVTTLQIRRIRTRWAGLRSFAPDRTPVIGFDGDAAGFFWLAGQGGYGIQTAPAAAALAAALLRDEAPPPELSAFDPGLVAPTRLRKQG